MYAVPVIPPDLRHEETIIQAANALDCLQSTITNIFDRIDIRISKNNTKINELSSRINAAALKIRNLSGTNKAIKIYSPPKFPSSHVFQDIELTFKEGDATTKITLDYEIASRVDPVPNNLQEKLVFFHFRSAKDKSTAARVSNHRGLGEIPPNIKSVNSVLLFSTAEKVYGTRRIADDMNRGQRNRSKTIRKTENEGNRGLLIEPAPLSLSNRQKGADKRVQQGLFYTPRLKEAPVIDLPVDLPDLPGIADDIQFDHADNHQIAPSLFIDNLTDLPEIVEPVEKRTDSSQLYAETVMKYDSKPITPAPPPPPPPPSVVPTVEKSNMSVVPPPPPPPPLQPMMSVAPKMEKFTHVKPQKAQSDDVRSNLMDAIRKAGGARGGRLRAAADVARQPSSNKSASVSNPTKCGSGVDLMADLHNKLLMRRKGISGAKEDGTASDNGNIISRLSALIPPPPPKVQNTSSDDENEGDDADWAD